MTKMCAVGDNVTDRYLASGVMYPGGGAVNVAVHARRAGADAGYLGLLGDDLGGDVVLAALAAEGVDTTHARRVPEPNAVTDVAIGPSGERVFEAFTTVAAALELGEDDEAYLSGRDWVYTNYSSAAEHLVPRLAELAPVAFDFSYKDEEYAAPLLPHVTVAAFSRAKDDDDAARALIARVHAVGVRFVVITRGAAGALIGHAGEVLEQPAVPVEVVDTLGAGDAYLAHFVHGVLGGRTPAEAAEAAGRAAADVCLVAGAFGHPHPIPVGKEQV